MRVLTLPWAFGGSVPPTTRTLPRAAPPGGPHGRLGRRSRFPISPYPPWQPAAPRTGHDFGSGGHAPSQWGRFGRGNGHGHPPGIYTLAARPRPAKTSQRPWRQAAAGIGEKDEPLTPLPCRGITAAPTQVRNTSGWPGRDSDRQWGVPRCPWTCNCRLVASPGAYPEVTPQAVCQAVEADYLLAGRRFHPCRREHPFKGCRPGRGRTGHCIPSRPMGLAPPINCGTPDTSSARMHAPKADRHPQTPGCAQPAASHLEIRPHGTRPKPRPQRPNPPAGAPATLGQEGE